MLAYVRLIESWGALRDSDAVFQKIDWSLGGDFIPADLQSGT